MLKTYEKLEDVPEALRSEYKLIGGRYVPDLSDDHPVLVNNKTLLNEKNAAETKASGLESANTSLKADLESANAGRVQRGHVVVTKAEAESLAAVKEHGTAAEIATKLTEHKALSEKVAKQELDTKHREVAKALGYDNADAFVRLQGLPEFEKRTGADGKESWIAKVADDKGVITESDAQKFIEGAEHLKPFLSALKVSGGGIDGPGETRDRGKPNSDLVTRNQQIAKDIEKAGPQPNLARERFGLARPAEATQ